MIEAVTSAGGTLVRDIQCGRSLNLTLDNIDDSRRSHLLSLIQERKVPTTRSDLRVFRTLVSRFLARLTNRLFIVRYLRARSPYREKRIVLFGGRLKGQIPGGRITRRRCLLSISFLGEKIVLRARFGSITAQKTAENGCAIRMLTTEFIGNGMWDKMIDDVMRNLLFFFSFSTKLLFSHKERLR